MDVIELHRRTVETFLERVEAIGDDAVGRADAVPGLGRPGARQPRRRRGPLDGAAARRAARSPRSATGSTATCSAPIPSASANDAAAEAVAAVGYQLPAGGTVHLSYGDEDMAEYVHQLAADHLIHAWDLAVATGGDTALDPELVAAVATWFADREELYRGAGVIGARVELGGGDDPASRLLAAFGRDPLWVTLHPSARRHRSA